MLFVEKIGIEAGAVPINTTGAAVATTWLSLQDFAHLAFLISQGAWAGGTPAVTLSQATDNAGTGAKALAFNWFWSKAGITAGQWARTAVVANTFNLPATANLQTLIEVNAADLDVGNGFNHVQLGIASPGANADFIAVMALLGGPRYQAAAIPDAKV